MSISLPSLFSEELLAAAARSIPVKRGGWSDLFLERLETVRGEWDSRSGLRISPGIREGFAARSVSGAELSQVAVEGLDPDRIVEECRAVVTGSSRLFPPLPIVIRDRPGPAPGASPVAGPEGEIRSLLEETAAAVTEAIGGEAPAGIVIEWRRREILVAAPERAPRSDVVTRAIIQIKIATPRGEISLGLGSPGLAALRGLASPGELSRAVSLRLEEGRDRREAPAGEIAVVLAAGTGGIFFHEACGHALEADLVLRGASIFRDLIGERIAGESVGAVDDPSRFGLEGSYGCDDEGIEGRTTALIERGILRGFLTDRVTSGRLGRGSTGNGRRESFRDLPVPRMSNTFLMAGEDDPEAIVRETPKGIYVERLDGGRADTATGDFLFRAGAGRLIESGRLTAPLGPFTLSGNGLEALRDLDRVGNDLSFGSGAGSCGKDGQQVPVEVGQPTIRIRALAVRSV